MKRILTIIAIALSFSFNAYADYFLVGPSDMLNLKTGSNYVYLEPIFDFSYYLVNEENKTWDSGKFDYYEDDFNNVEGTFTDYFGAGINVQFVGYYHIILEETANNSLIVSIHKCAVEAVAATSATCTTDGNVAYYKCTTCNKMYSDIELQNELSLSDVTIPAGHSYEEVQNADISYSHKCTAEGCGYVADLYVKINGEDVEATKDGDVLKVSSLALTDDKGYSCEATFTTGTATYSRTMTNQWGTLCLPMSLTVDDSNCEYFTLESAANDEITLSKITDSTIPAGMPVIVRCTSVESGISVAESDVEICTAPAEGSSTDGLTLTGTFTEKDVTGQSGYYFADDSFCNIGDNEVIIAPFRAYLAGAMSGDASQLEIRTVDDTATAIDMLNATGSDEATAVYDLQGRKLKSLQQGVNIVKMSNGQTKKVIIK